MSTTSSSEETRDTLPETFFESFYDGDSGVWSLRRVSTMPPAACEDEAAAA